MMYFLLTSFVNLDGQRGRSMGDCYVRGITDCCGDLEKVTLETFDEYKLEKDKDDKKFTTMRKVNLKDGTPILVCPRHCNCDRDRAYWDPPEEKTEEENPPEEEKTEEEKMKDRIMSEFS